MPQDAEVQKILSRYRTVAVVGLSRDQSKDSYLVAERLKKEGFKIIPVNPFAEEILGEKCYKSLLEMPEKIQKTIEVVDIFRPAEEVMSIVHEAIQLKEKFGKPHVIWMQLGIINEEAAKTAEKAGLIVVMNKCIMQEYRRLFAKADLRTPQI
ncbi:MAG: CoA-binding protein [Candidatus Bathyarchaeia archaeon]